MYRWEFDKGKKSLSVSVSGPLIVDDVELVVRAALDGVGLAFVSDDRVADHLANGALIRILDDWCQPFPGFFLYLPQSPQSIGRVNSFDRNPSASNKLRPSPPAPLIVQSLHSRPAHGILILVPDARRYSCGPAEN